MATLISYLNLITSEHREKPNFVSTVSASVDPLVSLQNVLAKMPLNFDIDTAIGKQLDILGIWIGRSRYIKTPLVGVYFTFDDTIGDGWDSGVWQGPFDPTSGLVSLPDENYRTLLKAKIAANHWNGSIPDAYKIWTTVFSDSIILIQDNQNMSMTVGIISSNFNAIDVALLTGGYIPLKPEGVRIAGYLVSPGPMFAFDADSDVLAGWDEGLWAVELTPT